MLTKCDHAQKNKVRAYHSTEKIGEYLNSRVPIRPQTNPLILQHLNSTNYLICCRLPKY